MNRADQLARADQLVDRLADRLRQLADRAAAQGGVKAKLAEPLAEDAAFVRKLKPSLIVARAKGEVATTPTTVPPDSSAVTEPMRPQLGSRPRQKGEGPNPFLVVGGALVIGIVLAKVIDWRGHAHPRD